MKIWLALGALIIGVSAACSASRSASPTSLPNGKAATGDNPASVVSTLSSQQKSTCSLSVADAPTMYGLKLGMTPDEVLAVFPGSKDDTQLRSEMSVPPTKFGMSSFIIRPSKYETKEKFAEISQITFTFLDGRVSNFTLGYNGPEWPHVDKFVAKLVEGTSLPPAEQWEPYVGLDTQMKVLTCTDFAIQVYAGGQGGVTNYVLIRDLEADKRLKERRDKAKAKPTPA